MKGWSEQHSALCFGHGSELNVAETTERAEETEGGRGVPTVELTGLKGPARTERLRPPLGLRAPAGCRGRFPRNRKPESTAGAASAQRREGLPPAPAPRGGSPRAEDVPRFPPAPLPASEGGARAPGARRGACAAAARSCEWRGCSAEFARRGGSRRGGRESGGGGGSGGCARAAGGAEERGEGREEGAGGGGAPAGANKGRGEWRGRDSAGRAEGSGGPAPCRGSSPTSAASSRTRSSSGSWAESARCGGGRKVCAEGAGRAGSAVRALRRAYRRGSDCALFPQIKYTGFRDRPHEERQARFQNACRDGRSEIVSAGRAAPGRAVLSAGRFAGSCPRLGPRCPQPAGARRLSGASNAVHKAPEKSPARAGWCSPELDRTLLKLGVGSSPRRSPDGGFALLGAAAGRGVAVSAARWRLFPVRSPLCRPELGARTGRPFSIHDGVRWEFPSRRQTPRSVWDGSLALGSRWHPACTATLRCSWALIAATDRAHCWLWAG